MVEIRDKHGATLVVPVVLGGLEGRGRSHVNILKSAYTKNYNNTKAPRDSWFIEQIFKKKNARYSNRQKWRQWLRAASANSDLETSLDRDLYNEVVAASFSEGALPSNAAGNSVYTEADLVNLRQRKLTRYQAGKSGKRASVTFQPGGEAVIRLFRGADLSSIPREAAHIFVEDLLRVAESDGAIARERLRSGLEEVAPADEDLRGLADSALSGSLDTDGLRALPNFRVTAGRRKMTGNRTRYCTDKARWGGRGRGTPGGGKKKTLAGNSDGPRFPVAGRPSASAFYIYGRPECVQTGKRACGRKRETAMRVR